MCSLVFQKQKETLLDPKKRQDLLFHKVIQAVKNKALCAEEPHQMQAAFSWGTGFLIRPDIVITAGHNIFNYKNESYINWENLSIYFGCFLSHHSQKYPSIEEKEEYKIKKILWVTKVSNQDFAVLQLDRDAKGVPLLPLNQNKRPTRGTPIYTIGHGNSLPAKFTPGAHFVKRFNRNYFSANLDTFSGNSGSPVFNACTHEVEGILVKGLKDYELVPDGSCYTTKKYNRKHGEKVQIIGPVVQMLNHLNI
ncbi:MAG: serine protease [Bacteroidota bacterium]